MVNTRTDAELAAAVQAAVDAMLPQIREQVREEYRTGAVASGSNPPPVTIHTWLERFNKQKPRSFEKAVAPVDAENWISHMEKIFDVMDCNDAFKTRLAVYKFEGDALAWWKAYKQAKGGDAWVLTLTWAAFKELFFLQFFPRADEVYAAPENRRNRLSYGGLHKSTMTSHAVYTLRMLLPGVPAVQWGTSYGYTHPVVQHSGHKTPRECRRACWYLLQMWPAVSSSAELQEEPLGASDIHAPEFIYHVSLPGKPMKIISALKAPDCFRFQERFPEELPGIPPIRDV
ncbi:hypothetical protein Tco_1561422 [Tanacetum coccineum]